VVNALVVEHLHTHPVVKDLNNLRSLILFLYLIILILFPYLVCFSTLL
jgi:hypothetical protein